MKNKGLIYFVILSLSVLIFSCTFKKPIKETAIPTSTEQVTGNLQIGQPAPEFNAISTNGKNIKLSGLKGSWIVLYFYPKAFTGG